MPVATNGSYSVEIDGVTWFRSAPTVLSIAGKPYSTADGSMVLSGTASIQGDGWSGTELSWEPKAVLGGWSTRIKVFGSSHVVFEQRFGTNLTLSGGFMATVRSAFPSWRVEEAGIPRGVLAFKGGMCGLGSRFCGRN